MNRIKDDMVDETVQELIDWFFENYQDPVHEMPVESGEYIFIDGGPYDAREILYDQFGGDKEDDVILAAVEEIESHGYEWSLKDWSDSSLFEDLDYWAKNDPSGICITALEGLDEMIQEKSTDNFVKLYYANAIAIFEAYLFDKFVSEIFDDSNETAKKSLLFNHPNFKDHKINLPAAMDGMRTVDGILKKFLHGLVWHKLKEVGNLYKHAFEIEFEGQEWFGEAVKKRHDIVHRNGKDLEGNRFDISVEQLEELINHIRTFQSWLDGQFWRKLVEDDNLQF